MFRSRLADAAARCGLAPGARLAVAASGGADSAVLFRSLRALGFDAAAVYVHHGLRPDADAEAEFVAAMAREAGAESAVVRAPVGAGNRQAAARDARYAALAEAAERLGCEAVATGHTATDQAETVLLALVRGAGLRGLAGMAPRRPLGRRALVRPLLWATRAEVEAEARARGWAWRDDASNATDAYRRNRLRHTVLPLLDAEGGPRTAARVAHAAEAARAALDASPAAYLAALAEAGIPLGVLRADPSAVLAEALRASGAPRSRAVVARLVALLDAPPGRRVGLGRVTVWRDRDALRFVADREGVGPVAVTGPVTETPAGRLFRTPLAAVPEDGAPEAFPASPLTEVVDARALAGPLVLRRWQPGDRLAAPRARRVADLLAGVEPSRRAEALVLSAAGQAVWLIGHRLGAHARVTAETRRAERLDWAPSDAPSGLGP